MQVISRRLGTAVIASAIGLGASKTFAALIIDVRAVSATGTTIVLNAKEVRPGGPGDVITFNVFAVVTGSNATSSDDGILSFAGSFLSADTGEGTARGSLLAARTSAMFGSGGSNGLQQDLDSDGDLDVGSNNNGNAANFFSARSKDAPNPQFGMETLAATITMTISQVLGTTVNAITNVNFRQRVSSTSGSWFEDGSQITSSNYTSGANVQLVSPDPEPSCAVLSATSVSLGLLARRRLKSNSP